MSHVSFQKHLVSFTEVLLIISEQRRGKCCAIYVYITLNTFWKE